VLGVEVLLDVTSLMSTVRAGQASVEDHTASPLRHPAWSLAKYLT
jgi:hypothetical protein